MVSHTEDSLGTTLFEAVLASNKLQVPGILRELAKKGKIDALVELDESGLINPDLWDSENSKKFDMAYAIGPLVDAVSNSQRPAAEKLVASWMEKFGGNDLRSAIRFIRSCPDGLVVYATTKRIGRLANANDRLAAAVDAMLSTQQPAEAVLALLRACSELGLAKPLESTLLFLADGHAYNSRLLIIEEIEGLCTPFAGEAAFGRQAADRVIEKSREIEEQGELSGTFMLQGWLTILLSAHTSEQQWRDVAARWSQGNTALYIIAKGFDRVATPSVRAIERIIAAGIPPDTLLMHADTPCIRRSLLHQAVEDDNLHLATLLLNQGADPSLQTERVDGEHDAFSLATEGSEMESLLNAWSAKTAIMNTVTKARKAIEERTV